MHTYLSRSTEWLSDGESKLIYKNIFPSSKFFWKFSQDSLKFFSKFYRNQKFLQFLGKNYDILFTIQQKNK